MSGRGTATPGPRRVLQVFAPLDGGVAEHVVQLSRGMRERGWEVDVAAQAASPAASRLRDEGFRVHALDLRRLPHPRDLAAARSLRAIDRDRRFEVVHAHSSKAGALVRAALPACERFVYTPHCFAFAAAFGRLAGLQRQLYRVAEQVLLPRTGTVIAASHWELAIGRRRLAGLAARACVVHNGVPPCPDPAADAELLAFRGDEPLVGTVAVLRPQKDPLTLVRAAAVLERQGRLDFKVAVVGNGELRDAVVTEIERLGLGQRVRWFPFSGGSSRYLVALDAFVLPSLWESLPIAVLEALACGRPVVATHVGGTPEAVQDGVTGRLFAPGDVAELAQVLDEVMHDPPLRAALGEAGRALWRRSFGLERMVDEVAELYERVPARPRTVPRRRRRGTGRS